MSSEQWKFVPVDPTEEMIRFAGVCVPKTPRAQWIAMLEASPLPPSVGAASAWREGAPPHPWDSEWFLAQMIDGAYAVLRPLPEDFTYDFTTADATYFMRHKVKRWAQLSDSDYIERDADLSAQLAASQARARELEAALNELADWPCGGNKYGQNNMMRFAAKALAQDVKA